MPSSKEKRAQRHQAQTKQNVTRFQNRGKVTEKIAGIGYRETQLIGGKKYYTALSDDPNVALGGSTTNNVTVIGDSSGGVSSHSLLGNLDEDDHTQYVLVDGTRAFDGDWTNATNTIADLGTVTTADINGGNIDGMTIATSDIDVTGQILALDNNQISGDKVEGGTIDSITINTLGGSLDANSQVITNVDIQSGDISGTNIDVTSKTLSLDDDQISGDKVDGGTIASITIDQIAGPLDANSQAITNINVDSGDISGTDVDVTSQTLLLDNDQISGDKVEGGAIDAITISQLTGAMDANSQSMTNVNIDSGAIDAVTIGTNSVATRIKVDSLDLNGYSIESTSTDGLQLIASGTGGDLEMDIITGKFILIEDTDNSAQTEFHNDGGNFSIKTISGDILLDSSSGNFYFRKDGDDVTQTLMTVNDLDGEFTIDTEDSGNITLKPSGGHVYVNDGSNNIIEFDGADPSITIKDDADTGDYFKITVGSNGGTVFTTVDDDGTDASLTMTLDGYFKVDSADEIVLDVASGNSIIFKEDNSSIFTFDPSSPELTVFGVFTINPSGGLILEENGVEVIKIDTDRNILFNQYNQTPYNFYGWNNKATLYHFTTGYADFQENLSCISMFEEATTSEAYPI